MDYPKLLEISSRQRQTVQLGVAGLQQVNNRGLLWEVGRHHVRYSAKEYTLHLVFPSCAVFK